MTRIKKSNPHHLVLFFSGGVSLKTWDDLGIFDREVAAYRFLQESGIMVTFVTHGDARDLTFASRIPGIHVLCNRWGISSQAYRRWLPVLHAPTLIRASIFKTHQAVGADRALLAAKYLQKKLIARCGYLLSDNMIYEHGVASPEAQRAKKLEFQLFTAANQVVVTTSVMKQAVAARYRLPPEKITVIPNYVDTALFSPTSARQFASRRICFIGRLDEGKNLSALLDALSGLDVELLVIGDGKLREQLINKAKRVQVSAKFLGSLENGVLPWYINSSALFVLPSLIEGHPKALIEAMACGVPVIGTNVQGIRELITHRQTGFLCGISPIEIRAAIQEVLADPQLMERMGGQARSYVLENFSIGTVLQKELALLHALWGD